MLIFPKGKTEINFKHIFREFFIFEINVSILFPSLVPFTSDLV